MSEEVFFFTLSVGGLGSCMTGTGSSLDRWKNNKIARQKNTVLFAEPRKPCHSERVSFLDGMLHLAVPSVGCLLWHVGFYGIGLRGLLADADPDGQKPHNFHGEVSKPYSPPLLELFCEQHFCM